MHFMLNSFITTDDWYSTYTHTNSSDQNVPMYYTSRCLNPEQNKDQLIATPQFFVLSSVIIFCTLYIATLLNDCSKSQKSANSPNISRAYINQSTRNIGITKLGPTKLVGNLN